MFSKEELTIYKRQILFLGQKFQEKLKESSVAIVGLGGLGSPVAYYLTAAGVGRIKLIDKDKVELSNLNRQILYDISDIGKFKADAAYEKLSKLNPYVKLEKIVDEVNLENGAKLLGDVDLILDCTDGWKNKLILNDISIILNKPLIHAGVREFYGQLFFMIPNKTACLRCIFPKEINENAPIPIIGVTTGLLGILQATEAIKFLGGLKTSIIGKLLIVDLLSMSFDLIEIENDEECIKKCQVVSISMS